MRIEAIVVGNEVLSGSTLDTNSNWLAKRITGLGGKLVRVTTVPDDTAVVAQEIQAALGRRVTLLFTLGGLGPTADDITLEAVARAANCPLRETSETLALVESRYADFFAAGSVTSPDLTPERRKMAQLPQNSRPLPNQVGAAPGSLLRVSDCYVVSLPGVPAELRYIVEQPLAEYFREWFGAGSFAEDQVFVDCNDESLLAPLLRAVGAQFADVYVKSRPKAFERKRAMRVTFAARGNTTDEAQGKVKSAREAFEDVLRSNAMSLVAHDGSST